jgi:hypothetical protein
MEDRESQKFHAIWDFDRMISPRKRRLIGATEERHSIILVDHPLPKRSHPEWKYAFYTYIDGFEGISYLGDEWGGDPAIQKLRHFPTPGYAPEDLDFLLALTAGRILYMNGDVFPYPLRTRLIQEDFNQGAMPIHIPAVPGERPGEIVYHPYRLTEHVYEVTLGWDVCEVKCVIYRCGAVWRNGQCWKGALDNWTFLSKQDLPIRVYSQPGKFE